MAVHFFYEDTSFRLTNEENTRLWIKLVLDQHNGKAKNVNYIFCSDQYLLKINQEYLNHNTYTDIITFENTEETGKIEADIFISIDRVKENAQKLASNSDSELHRVIIHGVLHLLGFNDKTEADKNRMREKEDACLSLR